MKTKSKFKVKSAKWPWLYTLVGAYYSYSILEGNTDQTLFKLLLLSIGLIFLGSFLKTKGTTILFFALSFFFLFMFFGYFEPGSSVCVIRYSAFFPTFFDADTAKKIAEFICDTRLDFPFAISILLGLGFLEHYIFPNSNFQLRYFRSLLEAAAKSVDGTSNGYTGRPYPVGRVGYSPKKIKEFAKFLQKHLIATSYIDKERVTLVFSNGLFQYIPFLKPDLTKTTYMTFDYDGNSSVYISRNHYKEYKAELTFDELCNSMGKMVLSLLSDFMNGKRKLIVEKIKRIQTEKFMV